MSFCPNCGAEQPEVEAKDIAPPPSSLTLTLDEPITVNGQEIDSVTFKPITFSQFKLARAKMNNTVAGEDLMMQTLAKESSGLDMMVILVLPYHIVMAGAKYVLSFMEALMKQSGGTASPR